MKCENRNNIRIEDLLKDTIMRTHLGTSCNQALMSHQLLDPSLMGLDLDEICEMDIDALITDVLQAQDLIMSEQADFVALLELEQARRELQPLTVDVVPEQRIEGEQLVRITFDNSMVEAYITMTAPEECGSAPSERAIRTALLRSGVVYGVKEDYIDRLVQHPIYNRKIKIAEGKAPQSGKDGAVIYHFVPVVNLAPKIGENGIADYKSLDYVQSVKKGDLLCDIVLATVGTTGISVCGDVLTGITGKSVGLVHGVNTMLSDDRTKLYATCDGQVFLKGRTVYVGRIVTVDNVDASTGNILFVGSVHVRGDVASGFSVRAGGNIIVDGVAENAVLVAGSNVVICGGIKGNGKDMVVADGSVRALYVENARIQAHGNVYADSILNSYVESTHSINLFGRNGKLIGGVCTAGEKVQARQIGNDANLATIVNVRDPDTFGKQKAQNMLTIAKYKEAVARLAAVAEFAAASHLDITPPEVMLCRAVVTKIRIEREIEVLELQNSETGESQTNRRCVEVMDVIYPNTSFMIDDARHKNDVEKPGCTVSKVNGKLVFRTY
ncbi:MAG: FapA family protein [Angelakisella sp.]